MSLSRIDRRTFGLGAAGAWLAGCEDTEEPERVRTPTTQRVAIVGGGIAGLNCALWLAQANVEVQLYEALSRLGGRVLTARDVFRPSQPCELGAEYVGAYDAAMRTLAAELSIKLGASIIPEGYTARHYLVDGSPVDASELSQGLAALLPKVEAAMATDAGRATLDNTTLDGWLAENVVDGENLLRALTAAYRTDFGLEPSELSAMHLSALLGPRADGPLRFFPLRDAALRCQGATADNAGMDQFSDRILQFHLPERVHFECRLRRIARHGEGFKLRFERENGLGFETEAEHVVLALPFTALRDVDLTGLNLERGKRQMIAELGYGTSVKLAATFAGKPWRLTNSTGDVLDDTRRIWDGTLVDSITIAEGVLTSVIGGNAGLAAMAGSADEQFAPILSELSRLFDRGDTGAGTGSDFGTSYRPGSAVRASWPSLPFARGSASCLRPGQWSKQASIGRREGALHFCGEHCSLDFQGRLEGAAESGALVAAEILEDLKRPMTDRHAALVALKRKVFQPYGAGPAPPPQSPLERAETVAAEHAQYLADLEG